MTPAMGAVLHCISSAVAMVEGSDPMAVRNDIYERLAIAVARSNARAIARRRMAVTPAAAAIHRSVQAAAALLEEPNG